MEHALARRSPPRPEPQHAVLSPEQIRRGIARLRKRIEEVEAFDPQKVTKRFAPEVETLSTAVEETLAAVFGSGTIEYNRYLHASQIDVGARVISMIGGGGDEPLHVIREDLAKGKESSLAHLRQAVRFLEEELADKEQASPASPPLARPTVVKNKIFLVHGHDEAALQGVARFLEKLELEAVILREQPDQGRTIIEKFEACAAEVGFAVILLTPDDLGAAHAASVQAPRARQNVLFELGFFAGRLGRGRTCLMRKGDVEVPSDLYGVIYTDIDPAEAWKMKLVRELKAAGLEFDANKMWS